MMEEGFNGTPDRAGGAFPSMGILLHEMGHAALYNEYGKNRENIFANEELMIIFHLEKKAMQNLGFGYRSEHNVYPNRESALEGNRGSIVTGSKFTATYYIPSPSPISLKK